MSETSSLYSSLGDAATSETGQWTACIGTTNLISFYQLELMCLLETPLDAR